MADFIGALLPKRRTRLSSDNSTKSNSSPNPKKQKECDPDSPRSEYDEDSDEVLTALNMAGAFKKTLEDIHKKLEKLDSIEDSVKKLNASFGKLEGRIKSLEAEHTSTKQEIEELKQSLNSNEDDKRELSEKLKSLEKKTDPRITALEKENNELRILVKEIEDKNLYLEAYSRRENVKFENIPEERDRNGSEDTERVLRSFLGRELGFSDAENVEIQRVHRVGKNKEGKPRPILARFLRYKDCEKLFSLGRRLRETDYRMYQDLPFEIVERRKVQMDTFKKARRNNISAGFSKAQPDKLYIRGKLWPVGKPLDL